MVLTRHAIYKFWVINYRNVIPTKIVQWGVGVQKQQKIIREISQVVWVINRGQKNSQRLWWMNEKNFVFTLWKILPSGGSIRWYEVIVVSHICVVLMTEVSNSLILFDSWNFSAEIIRKWNFLIKISLAINI